jgi:hypothetical protein
MTIEKILSMLSIIACLSGGYGCSNDSTSLDSGQTDQGRDAPRDTIFDDAPARDATRDAAPKIVWSSDFEGGADDPADDDTGDGDYSYPSGVKPKSADLRQVSLRYSAKTGQLQLSIALSEISDQTRVGVLLLDQVGFQAAARDWTIGGTELRAPAFTGHGVNVLLGKPSGSLFDYAAKNPNPAAEPRPDNAIYVSHLPTTWLGQAGSPTADPGDVQRVEVVVKSHAKGKSFDVALPVTSLIGQLDTLSPKLYLMVYGYLLTGNNRTEFGSFDPGAAEGGTDSWEDSDAYDIAFVDSGTDQSQLLTVSGQGEAAAVVLERVGQGFLEISTGP